MQTQRFPRPSGNDGDPEPLGIEVSRLAPDSLVVTPVGEADIYTVPSLRQALDAVTGSGCSHVTVDLDRLTFMDASFLRVLVEARSRLYATGGTLQVRCLIPRGRRLLSLTGLDDLLDERA
jgi:anti-sigma B factor antagonist